MNKSFYLEILTPSRTFYRGECVSLTVPLDDGAYGIMANHVSITAAIIPGEATFTVPDGTTNLCSVSQGIIDVKNNTVKLLCESVLRPDEIDESEELMKVEKSKEDMRSKQGYKDYVLSEILLKQAMNNLRVKKHDKANINQR